MPCSTASSSPAAVERRPSPRVPGSGVQPCQGPFPGGISALVLGLACLVLAGTVVGQPQPEDGPRPLQRAHSHNDYEQARPLALALERKFSKDQILELYLNKVYFGGGAYGIDAASRKFFGHPATNLSLAEAAVIAGLVKAPSDRKSTRLNSSHT